MNKSIIIACGLLLSMSACKDKNDFLKASDDTNGSLALSVAAEAPTSMTRANDINTDNFPVTIQGQGTLASWTRSYNTVGEVPSSILMPVGTYTITAHTPGTLERKMDTPYYLGSEDVEIIEDVTSRKAVVCTMANSRIRLDLTDDFKANFKSWTITINDGTDQALAYDENSSYADVFWHFINQTMSFTVDVRAVTTEGNNIYSTNTYTKSSSNEGYMDIETPYFSGGESITIIFKPAVDPNGYVTGIGVTANIAFDNYDEAVEIELQDEGGSTDPDPDPDPDPEPEGDDIEVTFKDGKNDFTVPSTATSFPDVQVDFLFPTGLRNLCVSVAGSADFEGACSLMGLTEGDGLDLTSSDAEALGGLFALPKVGDKTYSFTLNETLWKLLMGFPGTQKFTLKAVDQNGKTKSGTLTINITE
ncbi:MAG: DUF4493 domain-containing protein [Bacteroidaceae bacterium]|nr:DUF4493 domain-containing protein [Bacteroidaceae bacterium]